MSEVQKPVLDAPAATTASTEPTTANTETSAVADKIAPTGEATTASAPSGPNAVNPVEEDKLGKGEELITSKAINEGVVNYKGPGLKGLLKFSKKYFWLSDAPLEHNHLSTYLSNEKSHEIAHPNVAQATQSGKGLLFYAKRAEDKDHPQGILNIADMSDLQKGDFNDFSLKLHGKNHTFQTLNKNERDAWIITLQPQMADAKAHREALIATPGYKSALDRYSKPTVASTTSKSRSLSRPGKAAKTTEPVKETAQDAPVVGATAAAPVAVDSTAKDTAAPTTGALTNTTTSTTDKVADTPVDTTTTATPAHHHGEEAAAVAAVSAGTAGAAKAEKDEKKAEKAEKKEDKIEKKASRSQSRGNKRTSIFGGLLGKKDDKDEKKAVKKEEKEEKKEIKAEEKAEKKEEKAEKKEEKAEIKAAEEAEKKEEVAEQKEIKAEEKAEKKEEKAAEKEAKHEGTGIAGGLDAAAIASRVMGEPVLDKKDGASTSTAPTAGTSSAAAPVTGTESLPLATSDGAADVTPTTTSSKTPATGTTSKAGKRTSVFGGLFAKKDTPKPTATETAPAVPAKGLPAKDEPSTVASTAPQLDNPVTSPTASATTGTAAETPATAPTGTTAATSEPAVEKAFEPIAGSSATPAAAATATTPTDKRRTSFFSGLGTKKEKSAGASSGDELTDGEGKKSSGVGGLFRKASRAVSKPATRDTTSASASKPAVPAAAETAAKPEEKAAEAKAVEPADVPLPKTETAAESLPNGIETATSGEKSELIPGEVGSNAIASHEKATPVEATA